MRTNEDTKLSEQGAAANGVGRYTQTYEGKLEQLLRSALRYIEMQLATQGKALNEEGVKRELAHVKGVSQVGTGRDICGLVYVDLDDIREALGEPTSVKRNTV